MLVLHSEPIKLLIKAQRILVQTKLLLKGHVSIMICPHNSSMMEARCESSKSSLNCLCMSKLSVFCSEMKDFKPEDTLLNWLSAVGKAL